MQPDKKQLEVLIIDYFRESYIDFPKGKIVVSESPDFTINMKSHNVLGVELTRLNPWNALPPDDLALAEIESQERIIHTIKELFERNSKLKLFVKFLFAEDKKIAQEREMSVAVQTVNLIRKAVSGKEQTAFFRLSIQQNQLPKGIFEILLVNHPGMVTSVWERSNNLGVSMDVVADIKHSIRKKDEKLRLYQKQHLNYYWLLITTDRLRGAKSFNLPNKVMNHKFESRFQHVFLFDLMKADIYQLI